MDFRGHLRLPEDAGTGIPVLLRLDDIFVVISSGEDELGAWRADDVVIERIFSNQFAIELDGESMVFIAQDALGFAYDGISAIEDLQERLTKRRVFKRSKKRSKQAESAPESEPAADMSQEVTPREAAVAEPADLPADEPVEEPVLAAEPQAIWSPPVASSPPAQTGAVTDPDFEVSVPEPVKRRVEAEMSDPRPDDVRVSYPPPSAPPPPAVESFTPPSTPAPEDTPQPVSPIREPEQAEPTSATPLEVPETAEPARGPSDDPVSPDSADAPDFEIEEVSAAATGVTWADDVAVEVEPDEPEIEIEEYVLPSAGGADMFAAPGPEIDEEDAEEPAASQSAAARRGEPGPETTSEEVDQRAANTSAVEGRHVADDPEISPPDAETPLADTETPAAETETPAADMETPAADMDISAVESSATETPAEEAVGSNGHRKSAKTDADSRESTKRERRHSLFGRSRDKKVPPHDHRYGEAKTIGGLTRQVCEVCGHVTFSGEDVYHGW